MVAPNQEYRGNCHGFPEETQTFITYARELRFEDKPDYSFLRNLIKKMAERDSIKFDFEFDWTLKNNAPNGALFKFRDLNVFL